MSTPTYIGKDDYQGTHSITDLPKGSRVTEWSAWELAKLAAEGVIFESFGHLRTGKELFGRTRYLADYEGNLHCYNSDGVRTIIHPAGRKLRIVTK